MTISKRAAKAFEILKNGGQFVVRLERDNYTGREVFKQRLIVGGKAVKGYGHATFNELRPMLAVSNSTSVSTYYKIDVEQLTGA